MGDVDTGPSGAVCSPDAWIPDESIECCGGCRRDFGLFLRKHHCRSCGYIYCAACSESQYPLRQDGALYRLRVCDRCFKTLTDAESAQAEGMERTRERTRAALLTELDLASACFQEAHAELGALIERSELPQLGAPLAVAQVGTRGAAEKSFHLCMSTRPSDDVETDGQKATKALVVVMRLPDSSPLAPDTEPGLRHLRQFLLGLDHPFVARTHDVTPALDDSALALVRQYWPLGSLKDRLHRLANPLQPAVQKYAPSECGSQFPFTRVRLLGRQILEALRYLRSVGLPCASVHSGNILMRTDEWCIISEMEVDLAGLEPMGGITVQMERPGPDNQKVIVPAVASAWVVGEKEPAVVNFGHILYEMVSGGRVLAANEMPPTETLPQGLIDAFELIFLPAAAQPGCRLKQLLELNVFADLGLHRKHMERLIEPGHNTLELRRTLRKALVGLLPPEQRGKSRRRETVRDPPASWDPSSSLIADKQKKHRKLKEKLRRDEADGVMLLDDGRLDASTVQVRYPGGSTAALVPPRREEEDEPMDVKVDETDPPPGTVKLWLQRIIGGYEVSGVNLQPQLNGRYYPVPQPTSTPGGELPPDNDGDEPIPESQESDIGKHIVDSGGAVDDAAGTQQHASCVGFRYIQSGGVEESPAAAPFELAWVDATEECVGRWDLRQGIAGQTLATGPKFTHARMRDGPPPTGWKVESPESAVVHGEGGELELTALVRPISMESYLSGLEEAGWDQLGDILTMTEEDFLDAGLGDARHRRLLVKAQEEIVWPLPEDAETDDSVILKRDMQALKLSELQQRAVAGGVPVGMVAEALDSAAQRTAMVAMIVAHETRAAKPEPQPLTGSEAAASAGDQKPTENVTRPIQLRDTVTVIAKPKNSDFLAPGDEGTVVDVDEEDPNDMWYTVQNSAGETDEYCAADLVHAQAAGWQIQEQARPTLELAHATGQYGILQSAWPSLTAECLSTAMQFAHLDLGAPLANPGDAVTRNRRGASKQAASRALDGLAACGVKSAVPQRAVLNEVRALLKGLLRSDRLVKVARKRKCTGRLGSKLTSKGFDQRFVASLEGIFDNGVLLVPLSHEQQDERNRRTLEVGDAVLVVAEPSNPHFLQPGQGGKVIDIEDEDPADLWYTVRDEDTGETDEYPERDLVLASSGLPERQVVEASAPTPQIDVSPLAIADTKRTARATKPAFKEDKSPFEVDSSDSDDDYSVASSVPAAKPKAASKKSAPKYKPPAAAALAPAPVVDPRSLHFGITANAADDASDNEFDDDLFGDNEPEPPPPPPPPPAPAPAPAKVAFKSAFDAGSDSGLESEAAEAKVHVADSPRTKTASARASLAALIDSDSDDGSLFD